MLSVTRRDADAAVTIAVEGEIDAATVGDLEAAIGAGLAGLGPARTLVVDLTGLKFIDSAGIGVLLHGRRSAVALGRPFRVAGATGLVLEVLRLTGVWPLLSGEPA
ncbi:STAS domain-containing protein [Dactylosporangium sp. CA-092794]|uniref:STAS domain-containing protein n=1 Tax=Dactylosporangium sp. CA-092794 TaxID=3239929 RepID=UPI003D949414